MKRIALLILAAIILLSLTACAQSDVVVCTVGDSKIPRSEYEDLFNAYYQRFQYQYDMTNEQNLESLQDFVLDLMVRSEVIYQYALSKGYTLTDDEKQKLEQDAKAQYDSIQDSYRNAAQSEGAADIDARAKELFLDALEENGHTEESLMKKLTTDMQKTAITEKLETAIKSEITFTEQDAQARFAEDVQADRTAYTEAPASFADAQGAYEQNGGVPPLYVPEGYVRVKHILVSDENTANDLIARLNAGEDFDALMAEYGTDPGMQSEPSKSLGYLMNADTSFVPEFKEAALALQNVGDITAPVKTDYGYHIIKLVDKLKSGARSFSDVKDAYMSGMLEKLQTAHFNDQVDAWEDTVKITRYADRIRDMGKAESNQG